MQKNNDQDQDFEYNDGLGDLLREKEKKEFSWVKTILVMLVLIVISFGGLKLMYGLFKPLLTKNVNDLAAIQQEEMISTSSLEEEIVSPSAALTTSNPEITTQAADIEPLVETKTEPVAKPAPIKQTVKSAVVPNIKTPVLSKKNTDTPKIVALNINKVVQDQKRPETARKYQVSNTATPFKVIVGVYASQANAKKTQELLAASKIDCFVRKDMINGRLLYRVQTGAFTNKEQARGFIELLKKKNFEGYILTE